MYAACVQNVCEHLFGVCTAAEAFSQAQATGGSQATAVSQALAQAGASNAQQVGLSQHGGLCWASTGLWWKTFLGH